MSGIQLALMAGAEALSATASPLSINGAQGHSPVVSTSTVCTPEGGIPGYTYSWSKVSESGGTFDIGSPTSATTLVSADMFAGQTIAGSIKCTVTDAAGNTVETAAVTIDLEHY